jgi:hypothetical protein
MTQFLTRREMREAERAGRPIEQPSSVDAETSQPPVETPAVLQAAAEPIALVTQPPLLSRREMRLAEAASQGVVAGTSPSVGQIHVEPEQVISEPIPVLVPEVILAAIEEATAETELPVINPSADILAADFTGSNLLAEPSTQSIVLDIAPEAISLPLEALDGVSTGSIAILPDPNTGALSGALDGLEVDNADRVDAVTGVISTMVEPVSAMDVINQRVTVAVVPDESLRKEWWQAWAYGALGLGLAVATIVATIAIITAVGE